MVVLTFWRLLSFFSVCYNVSASVTEHRLVNLTPGSKYNISLAAVTGAGEGPQVIRIINTLPENMTGNHLHRAWSVPDNTQDSNASFPPSQMSPFLPASAAVDPGCAVCDVFNLYILHLHVEAVSDGFGDLHCARSSSVFQRSPLIMWLESNEKSSLRCRRPSFQISTLISRRVRWEKSTCECCLCWVSCLHQLHQSGGKRHKICF